MDSVAPEADGWYERGLRDAALGGDDRAWRTLFQRTFEPLNAYVAWRCGGRREWTEEIVQETWLIAVDRLATFDPARAGFLPWLKGIAANVIRNHLRRIRRLPKHLANGTPPCDHSREDAQRIMEALASLPAQYEDVLRAKYLDRLSVAEIARATGSSCKAVESMLTRAREAFRRAYNDEE